MKHLKKYRVYIRAVLFSMLAAFIIDAVVNFDDIRNSFDKGRGKVSILTHSTDSAFFKVPEKVAVISGVFYKVIFE